jgi:hypothetical protein
LVGSLALPISASPDPPGPDVRQPLEQRMAVYTSRWLAQLAPDPRLRAAVALLVGTPAEGAIDVYRSGVFSRLAFDNGVPDATAIGAVLVRVRGTRPEVVVHPAFASEDPRVLAMVVAHEALHQDSLVSDTEEQIARTLDTYVYAQMILEEPQLARSGTPLVRAANARLLARLHGRATSGAGEPTPGNAYLRSFVKAVTGQDVANIAFDDVTLSLLDGHRSAQLVELEDILAGE